MEANIYINEELRIPGAELEVATSRSGGPGGQNVQKTDSRVTLRWNIAQSKMISEHIRVRLLEKLAVRLTKDGEIIVHVDSERSQMRNREIARERLAAVILRALRREKPRQKTKPSFASRVRRLGDKKHLGDLKKKRSDRSIEH